MAKEHAPAPAEQPTAVRPQLQVDDKNVVATYANFCRVMGTPEELGFAIASAADERNGYLAGVDILVDGGSTNGKKFR